MAKSNEAFFWSLFSAGGVISALFMPAIILSTGFLLPTGNSQDAADRYEKLRGVVGHPSGKLVLFVVIMLTLFHCAHRIQHTGKDVGLRPISGLLAVVCYVGALAGSVAAAVVLWPI